MQRRSYRLQRHLAAGGLDKIVIAAACFLTRIFVGFVVQRGFTGGDVLASESVVYKVLSTSEKCLYYTQQVRGHRSSPRV
jgi:hypothetical protein